MQHVSALVQKLGFEQEQVPLSHWILGLGTEFVAASLVAVTIDSAEQR